MIYFAVNTDNRTVEGIGATFQYEIICYVLARLHNVGYYYEGIKKLDHWQQYDITEQEWIRDANYFFNLPITSFDLPTINFEEIPNIENFIKTNDNIIVKFNISKLMNMLDNELSSIDITPILKELRERIRLDDKFKYFDSNEFNVALHIRKFNEVDTDPNPRRELFSTDKIQYYINLLNNIKTISTNFVLHIYSQGNEDEFQFLKIYNTVFHINEHPLISLYHMIHSDILITSNSSLSFVAYLLGRQEHRLCRNTFFHRWSQKNTIFVTDNGNF